MVDNGADTEIWAVYITASEPCSRESQTQLESRIPQHGQTTKKKLAEHKRQHGGQRLTIINALLGRNSILKEEKPNHDGQRRAY